MPQVWQNNFVHSSAKYFSNNFTISCEFNNLLGIKKCLAVKNPITLVTKKLRHTAKYKVYRDGHFVTGKLRN